MHQRSVNEILFPLQIDLRVSPQHWLSLDVQGVEGSTNVVAVDDLDLSAWPCTTSNSYFLCDSGQKIPQHEVTLTHSVPRASSDTDHSCTVKWPFVSSLIGKQ